MTMSSYQQFAELTMTDTSTGFSNPAYNVISEPGGGGGQEGAGDPDNTLANDKQLSRSNSLGEDPDHIEVFENLN